MNAEFTEQKIVVTTETVEGKTVTTITPAKVRKGLDANAFIGATICWAPINGCELVVTALESNGVVTLGTLKGDTMGQISYAAATGVFTFTPPANNEPSGDH